MADEQKTTMSTALTKVNDAFLPMIERQLAGNGLVMDGYAKQCVLASLSAIHNALEKGGTSFNDPGLDKSNVTQTLMSIAALKLNAAAHPREVYFQIRNSKVKVDGQDVWRKQIEMGIEGDGNDSILARFGRDVAKVGQFWLVRENDRFEYPAYSGLTFEPPKWTPTGKGAVVRVVYPIVKTDKSVEYHIAEREDVARNLMAHINNMLMNETFKIAENRFKATAEQKKEIDAKKRALLTKANGLGLGALDDPGLQPWISPAWTEFHSREQMIIRKMRNNVVKKIPKDFGSAFVEMTYAENADEAEAAIRREAAAEANFRVIDVETGEVEGLPAEATAAAETAKVAPAQDAPSGTPKDQAPPPVQTTLEQAEEPAY